MELRRSAKSAALGWVARSSSPEPDVLSSAALRAMKVRLGRGSAEGYAGGSRAAACVSVDFDVTMPTRYEANRAGTRSLLDISEKHGVPLTWAVCGRTAEEDPAAYESILKSSVKQEVGVHTYSHIYATETPEGAFEEDIRRCLSVLGMASAPRTFIFPKNREGHFGLLKRLGFSCYRGKSRAIAAPTRDEGLWNMMPVYYVDQKSLGAESLIRRFIDACISRSAVFHLWTHPWSLAIDGSPSAMASSTLEPVFSYLKQKAEAGMLSISTMGDISDFLDARGPAR